MIEAVVDPLGEIRPDSCYTLATFKRLSGLGNHAMATARHKGLRVRRHGKRAYILGADWIAFLSQGDSGSPTAAA